MVFILFTCSRVHAVNIVNKERKEDMKYRQDSPIKPIRLATILTESGKPNYNINL